MIQTGKLGIGVAIALVLSFSNTKVYAQYETPSNPASYTYLLERLVSIGPTTTPIPGVPLPRPTLVGNSFINNCFSETTFLLQGEEMSEVCFAKYDLVVDEFLVMKGRRFYSLPGKKVLSFVAKDSIENTEHRFVRSSFFTSGSLTRENSFFEIVVDGELPLVKVIQVTVQDPNYNIALDVGRRDYKVFRKEIFGTITDGSLEPLPPNRQISSLFGVHAELIQKCIEINGLDLRDENHLAAVFDLYNERRD